MLLDTIRTDSLNARKAREAVKATLLVTLLAEASRPGLDNGHRPSTDAEVVAVVRKFLKGVDESLSVLTDEAAIQVAREEKTVLEAYLPAQLTGDALRETIRSIAEEATPKAMGTVMALLKQKHGGAYDGSEASKLVKEILSA